jgi:hypothetical protein
MIENVENSNEAQKPELGISDVMRSFTLDDMKKCFIQGYTTHAEGFKMNIYDGEFKRAENIFDEWIKNYA